MTRFLGVLPLVPVLLLLSGCSEPQRPAEAPTAEAAPAEPVSAQSAFHKMFISARSWASDAQPLRIAQIDVDEVKVEGGKAAAWEAVFVSQGQRLARRYIYSVVHRPVRNLRGGVTADPQEQWSGGSGPTPFLMLAFKTDSTAAYKVAMEKGAAYAKKHPDQEVKFLLEKTNRFPNPAWRVFWGESVSTSPYSIFVDASTGQYLATGR
ncbi:MAG TPA: hypothetical protein VN428_10285 [Bryobacteraceae bacterium]|nr:hypothetical protein [Bryobacteraceae bacterium]